MVFRRMHATLWATSGSPACPGCPSHISITTEFYIFSSVWSSVFQTDLWSIVHCLSVKERETDKDRQILTKSNRQSQRKFCKQQRTCTGWRISSCDTRSMCSYLFNAIWNSDFLSILLSFLKISLAFLFRLVLNLFDFFPYLWLLFTSEGNHAFGLTVSLHYQGDISPVVI